MAYKMKGHTLPGINQKKSPSKWVQFIPMAISAVSAMSKKKEESPAKNKEDKKGKKPEVTVTITKDGEKMTRTSKGKTYKFTKNPEYNPKAKSRSSDSFSDKWIPEEN